MKILIKIFFVVFIFSSLSLIESCTGSDDDDDTTPNIPANSFKDSRDGNIYKYVQIGDQVWMAENLRYKTSSGAYYYNDDPSLGNNYGMLYTFSAAKKACPAGWHLPTDNEWIQLEIYLGMDSTETGKIGFRGSNEAEKMMPGGETGFNLQYGGLYSKSGLFAGLGLSGEFWTATPSLEGYKAYSREFRKDNGKIYREDNVLDNALSVRCVKD